MKKSRTFTVTMASLLHVFHFNCISKNQSKSFSKVGAHHQTAHIEHTICANEAIIYMTRAFMLHASLHWSENFVDDMITMIPGCAIEYLIEQQDSLQSNCSLRLVLIIEIFSELMSEDVLLSFWTLTINMIREFKNKINMLGWVSFLVFPMITHLWWQLSEI